MKNPVQFRKTLFASAMALAIGASSGSAVASSTPHDLTEARQETQIWTTYALNPHLRANDLKVRVHGNTATLTGNVEEGVSKELAAQIALGVEGIRDVDNQIVVQPGYTEPVRSTDRRYGEAIDDATITAAVKSKLLWSKYTDGLTTDVDTRWGKVKLTGTADSSAARDLAGRLAMNTRGVVSVDNQLVVSGAKPTVTGSARSASHEAGADVADSWITTKVKSTFLYSNNVDGSDISVSTTDGIVTLRGKVDSAAERALAIELASDVRGVKRVQAKGLTL